MEAGQRSSLILLALMVLALFDATTGDDYDGAFCTSQLTRAGKKQTATSIKPDFWTEYSTLSESTFFKVENVTEAMVTHQQLFYSRSHQQVVLNEERPDDKFWVFADQGSNDCIYKKDEDQCVAEEGDCKETAKTVGFGRSDGGNIVLGSESERMGYPTDIRKQVSFGSSVARSIKTTRIGVCSYRANSRETVVSIFHLLDPKSYTKMDPDQNTLVSALIFAKNPGAGKPSFRRIDFTDYSRLSAYQMKNGFRLGEGRCGTVKSKFTTRKLPKPTQRFYFLNQEFIALDNNFRATRIMSATHEDNLNSQINTALYSVAEEGQSEKNEIYKVDDFRGGVMYESSLTRGECTVSPLSGGSSKQQSSEDTWMLNSPNSTYLGIYKNRDIPCHVWRFDGPTNNENRKSTVIYTATSDWLRFQAKPVDMFFPVQKIERGVNRAVFQEIYEFKDNPGYDIPHLPNCFQANDTIGAEVTLLLNYQKDIMEQSEHFEYEFRTFIMKTAGIKSPIRIGLMGVAASASDPEKETIVAFRIYGRFVGFNDLSAYVYAYDPVTSQQAAEKINSKVDEGNVKFSLDQKPVTVNFKKGSFAVLGYGPKAFDNYRYFDSLNAGPSGYSAGAMGGVAVALLLVCLALGVAAVFAYKRWTEGGGTGLSFGMKSLQEDA